MNSLFSKILLSLVITVLIALALVMLMTRVNLNRGMIKYVEQQQATQLALLVPELTELYQQNGSWAFLQGSPRRWNRLIRLIQPANEDRPPPRGRPERVPPGQHPPPRNRPGNQKGRLFLLDADYRWVAGAPYQQVGLELMEPIEFENKTVGWLGFAPRRSVLPPEARLFLQGQTRALLISLFIALVVVLGVGLLLARHFSRPLRQLAETVDTLSDGRYDVRASVNTQDEIGRLGAGVNQLAESLESNRSIRQRWMADIAHELRTPVAILKGEIEAIQDGLRPADDKSLSSLSEEAEHLSSLVNDLQTLALSDAGALDFHMEPTDLSELVRQQLDAFDRRLKKRGISVSSQIPDSVVISGDNRRLRQLMHNLLENSVRYIIPNGTLEVMMNTVDGEVTICLDDSGPGLTVEQMEQLFERFYRVENSRSRMSGGSGLGLPICRNIVQAHQGSIQAESSPLDGLRIRVVLPA